VILVSHDRYLIEACTDRLWLVADGSVAPFDGDLDDYRRFVLSDRGDADTATDARSKGAAAPRTARAEMRRAAAQMRIELAPLRRRITQAEDAVKRHTDDLARIDPALAQAGLFARDPAKAAALAKARADAATSLARAERIGSPPAPVMRAAAPDRRASERPRWFRRDYLLAGGRCCFGADSASGPRLIELRRPRRNDRCRAADPDIGHRHRPPPRSLTPNSMLSGAPARLTTSHSVICNDTPPCASLVRPARSCSLARNGALPAAADQIGTSVTGGSVSSSSVAGE
jgi:hypothetical protein